MAVPKRKQGPHKTHSRRSANSKLPDSARAICSQCGAVKRPHHVCGACGFYKDREVIVTD